jgi:hypothetical protein
MTLADVHTTVSRAVVWGLHEPSVEQSELNARLASGHHLVAAAGTAPKFNAHMHAYVRPASNWAEQRVYVSPTWPETWLRTVAPADMLVSHVSFASDEWTVVLTHATTAAALASARVSERAAPVTQSVLARGEWPAAEVRPPRSHCMTAHAALFPLLPRSTVCTTICHLTRVPLSPPAAQVDAKIADGYTLTTVARAPSGRQLGEPTYVVVLTRSPSTILPRAMRSFGSCEQTLQRWRCDEKAWHRNWAAAHGVTVAASHSATDLPALLRKLLPGGFPHWAYRKPDCNLLGTSVLHVADGDVGSFWSSGALVGDSPSGAAAAARTPAVTLTIDLGTPRMVDEVSIFWGDVRCHRSNSGPEQPRRRSADVLCALSSVIGSLSRCRCPPRGSSMRGSRRTSKCRSQPSQTRTCAGAVACPLRAPSRRTRITTRTPASTSRRRASSKSSNSGASARVPLVCGLAPRALVSPRRPASSRPPCCGCAG